jgi:glycosyltransferase involved in cell wall biosynthesis
VNSPVVIERAGDSIALRAHGLQVFYAFKDSAQRRAALRTPAGSAERYCLFGLDQHASVGVRARHNLEREGPPAAWARIAGRIANDTISWLGGYGGDFGAVFDALGLARDADIVFSTVDTVGMPLVALRGGRLLRAPILYAAIGLPERLATLRTQATQRVFARALGTAAAIVAYSQHEVDRLERWLTKQGCAIRVVFVPFGVDTDYFHPLSDVAPEVDVVSIGRDSFRDFRFLVELAVRLPRRRFRIVTTGERRRALAPLPPNVEVEADISFDLIRHRLAAARVVALPIRPNTYSGATTVLLQAMAMGRPIVASRTAAISSGYGLSDRDNCLLVEPGDREGFERSVLDLLSDEHGATILGGRARDTAVRSLSWQRYANTLLGLLLEAAGRQGVNCP